MLVKKSLNVLICGVLFIVVAAAINITMQSSAEASLEDVMRGDTGHSDYLLVIPKFADSGWFIHAHNGKVRACNTNNASIVGSRPGPQCTNWE